MNLSAHIPTAPADVERWIAGVWAAAATPAAPAAPAPADGLSARGGLREGLESLPGQLRVRVELAEGEGRARDIDLAALPPRDGLLPDAEHLRDLVGLEPGVLAHEPKTLPGADPAGDQLLGDDLLWRSSPVSSVRISPHALQRWPRPLDLEPHQRGRPRPGTQGVLLLAGWASHVVASAL